MGLFNLQLPKQETAAPAADSASQRPRASKRQKDNTDTAEIVEEAEQLSTTLAKKLTIATAKLTLSNAQTCRATKSTMIEIFIMDNDNPIVTNITEATKKWAETAANLEPSKRMATIGMPYHHAWAALLESLVPMTQDGENIKLVEYSQELGKMISENKERYPTQWHAFEEHV
eukprot:TRINITY_DN37557_c0_g2_i1.p3 TRINITY_DN37557_c0_g2~~TRINITY_DN37557_c0_g2_i1.p3  ORF type:complete len:173 (-),score=68.29 TRINITY_DN37557_c0_g2_i1:872-1390(-)